MTSLNLVDSGQFMESSTFFKIVFDEVFNKNSINLVPTSHCIDLDIYENEDFYFVSAYLPGVKEEDIRLEYTYNNLLIINVIKFKPLPMYIRRNYDINDSWDFFRQGFYLRDIVSYITNIHFSNYTLVIEFAKFKCY